MLIDNAYHNLQFGFVCLAQFPLELLGHFIALNLVYFVFRRVMAKNHTSSQTVSDRVMFTATTNEVFGRFVANIALASHATRVCTPFTSSRIF